MGDPVGANAGVHEGRRVAVVGFEGLSTCSPAD